MKKEAPISFKLVDIDIPQFSVFEGVLETDFPVNHSVGMSFGADINNRIIGSAFRYQLEKHQKPFLKIEVTCYFKIEESAFSSQLMMDDGIVLSCGFAKHLAIITTGTARGVLYEKTKNTPFNKYILGLVNIDNMFTEDVVLTS